MLAHGYRRGRRQKRAAVIGTFQEHGAPTRSCTELVRLPSECIADNALRASRMGPWWCCLVRSPAASSMRSGLFRPPLTVGANGEGRKIRTSDLMHVRHPLWLTELCPREMVGAVSAALLASRMSKGGRAQAPLLSSYAPESGAGGSRFGIAIVSALARPHSAVEPHPRNGVPSRASTGNLALRTRPLCALSYGDRKNQLGSVRNYRFNVLI